MRILLENFTKRFGNTTVINEMTLEIDSGEMLALLGPSGCGKSTTLFAICGIHQVSGGRILFGDREVTDTTAQSRNVGVVFQNYALYPHMDVYENIAFPLTIRKRKKKDIEREVHAIAELVHIPELLKRKPAQLSGGQQQRVALARALIRKPDVLLLDEPLANLDAKLRLEMRSEIRRIQQETGITAILVTHDQVEAMSMCDRIAIMKDGKILQIDTPTGMYANPKNEFVAGFLGNPPIAFLEGSAKNGHCALANTDISLPLPLHLGDLNSDHPIKLGIRPELVGNKGSSEISGTVSFIETQGRENLYDITLANGSVIRSIQHVRDDIKLGDKITWPIDCSKMLIFDNDGNRL
ncbi:ABC transporter ATP-binding protein [uncultured Cohaesibacter sp.]|uniref:ABC transporter ATP-binding protein n=1 Tax=uncultured Cohaesibacter sp. TaxID=1002546 RepID=UPI002930EBE5|nr:ABC transporter ATP-binding protein [uncultured Cohaesibacter sp.]